MRSRFADFLHRATAFTFIKIIETAEGGISGVKGDVISLAGGE